MTGMLTRYNKKTVTVITDEGQHWNVAPSFLRKVDAGVNPGVDKLKVIPFKSR